MSYTKTTWVSGTTPTDAPEMNNIENGVSANDTAINSITGADGTALPSTNGPFTLANFINYLVTQIKAITGGAHWYTAPTTTIAALNTNKLDASAYTASDVLAKLLTVDGSGSLIDADKLDGSDSTAFAKLASAANFTSTLQNNGKNVVFAQAGLTGKFSAASTAPSSPADGDLWLDTSIVLG